MLEIPLVISLPIADRQTSMAFYRDVFGYEPIGEPAEDGVPEPLQFALRHGVRLMLVPADGFGWVLGAREVAPVGTSECLLSLEVEDPDAVAALVERARHAGASVITPPGQQPWGGYAGVVADPDGHAWMVVAPGLPEPPGSN